MNAPVDAIIVGSGPNGLAAGVALAQAGHSVRVLEASETIGGGLRSAELTLPGFVHDVCSAVHPMGILSPFFRTLPLDAHGLLWLRPTVSLAHPLDDGPAVLLARSLETTCAGLGDDGRVYRRLIGPFLERPHELLADVLAPLRVPAHPIPLIRFGLLALFPANRLARLLFRGERARALFAGCAAHSILPLTHLLTSALGLLFPLTAHVEDWPVAAGGSQAIAGALASYLRSRGGEIETGHRVDCMGELASARVVLFDTSPAELLRIASEELPPGYRRRLERYRYGPGIFKVDWALDGSIPWRDPACRGASTVHVGGSLEEICASEQAAWHGLHAERPFLILCQQSEIDRSRAPQGKQTGYAYCHVPPGSTRNMSQAIEAQVERFAPGFRDLILARHETGPAELHASNPNYVGGAITGGVADLFQLWTRPVARLDPYATPNPRIFLCSASTPPGGGVHGQCGAFAARSALRRLSRA